MPLSDHRQITPILDAVLAYEPRSVLDIGAGYGAYGTLLRQYLGESALIVGLEPWAQYNDKTECRWWAYDAMVPHVWPWAVPAAVEELGWRACYDVALVIDVLEHVPEDERYAWLAPLEHLAERVIIASPLDPERHPQVELPNPLERHYGPVEMATLPWKMTWSHHLPDSFIAVLETGA